MFCPFDWSGKLWYPEAGTSGIVGGVVLLLLVLDDTGEQTVVPL